MLSKDMIKKPLEYASLCTDLRLLGVPDTGIEMLKETGTSIKELGDIKRGLQVVRLCVSIYNERLVLEDDQ